ncbi:Hypothetical protein, putative, partial [Bodo saltans]
YSTYHLFSFVNALGVSFKCPPRFTHGIIFSNPLHVTTVPSVSTNTGLLKCDCDHLNVALLSSHSINRNLQHTATSMCFAVKCDKCGKTTWSGCGQHVETVKASVPADQWCTCPR